MSGRSFGQRIACGNRPNLLVGGFPEEGPGSNDLYQIYGNLLIDNPREALFQGSGRISFHDPTWTVGRDFAIENGRNAGG